MCIDVCTDMCTYMRTDMCTGMRKDACTDVSVYKKKRRAAVEQVLDRQVDVDAPALPFDLDPVAERRERSMRPARSAVPTRIGIADGMSVARVGACRYSK